MQELEFKRNLIIGGGAIIGAIGGTLLGIRSISDYEYHTGGLGGFGLIMMSFFAGGLTGSGMGFVVGQTILPEQIKSSAVYANSTTKIIFIWEI